MTRNTPEICLFSIKYEHMDLYCSYVRNLPNKHLLYLNVRKKFYNFRYIFLDI